MSIFNNIFFRILLFPVSIIYGIIVWIRNKFYDKNIFRSLKIVNCKLISVGNISVGGTGKTPVIKFLAAYLSKQGFKVAILSRGYRRASKGTIIVSDGRKILAGLKEAGDEPYLLVNQLKNIPVVVEADRYKGALTIQEQFRPDIILMDDAFQHRRLQRDLDVVLVDASVGFGWGLLLPAGFLREPIHSLKRSNLIWVTRIDQAKNLSKIVEKVRRYSSGPVIASEHRAIEVIQGDTGTRYELSFLKNKRILLFSGIANHGSFEKSVIGLEGKIVHHQVFPDHYQYLQPDIAKIINKGEKHNANIVLTTEKDFVRIKNLIPNVSNIYYLTIEIQIGNYRNILESVLNQLL